MKDTVYDKVNKARSRNGHGKFNRKRNKQNHDEFGIVEVNGHYYVTKK
jgi:hypothetical protein